MQVMCTTLEDFVEDSGWCTDTVISLGDTLTVKENLTQTCEDGSKVECYRFFETGAWSYDCRNFSPLPEQTADEMNEVEKEAIIM